MHLLPTLPDDARLWLFVADRPLGDDARATLLDQTHAFTTGWRSHGRPVRAEAAWVAPGVLAVGGAISPEELNAGVSGCGIDAMTRLVEKAAEAAGFAWAGGLTVAYLDGGTPQVVERAAFRRMAREGAVGPETPVIDVTAATVGELRARGVVRPAAEAWHGRTFGLASAPTDAVGG
ncbi:MAG TPA: hypothetical protein VK610_03730 [Rhodothermales bacterium]|nr:hypothetical protein [Rhodothermales bacterium]